MEKSRDIYLSGNGTITLKSDVDLGAGGLIVEKGAKWIIANKNPNNNWLILGGISTDTGAQVTYHAKTKDNDFLHKIGNGELIITSSSPDAGLRIGDGRVVLQNNDDQVSFKEIYFTSGRGTLQIGKTSNINTKHIYFGPDGGTLDMNGQNLTFDRIYASDSGAIIVNTNATSSTLSINNAENYLYHGQINSNNGGTNINSSSKHNLAFDGGIDNANRSFDFSGKELTFQGKPTTHVYVDYESARNLGKYGHKVLTAPTSATQSD